MNDDNSGNLFLNNTLFKECDKIFDICIDEVSKIIFHLINQLASTLLDLIAIKYDIFNNIYKLL